MRDPERIARILDLLEMIWTASPDLRLGQLIVDIMPVAPHHYHHQDLFYVEDEEMEQYLMDWLMKYPPNPETD